MHLFVLDESKKIQQFLKNIPEQPGVYKFFDKDQSVIYIGKAKNLQKRIRSYFQKEPDSARVRLLVKKIHAIETIVVEDENDAFILENTLIKQYQPRYNIRLKDDKSYPWICISKELFPRIFVEHQPNHQKNECYGPYPSYRSMYAMLDLVRNTFPIRTCKLNLTEENIKKGKFRVCLEYHIKKCKGPCEGKIDLKEYQHYIHKARKVIQGNFQEILQDLKREMKQLSDNLLFEKAQEIKEKIQLLQNYKARSIVVDPSIRSCDVVSMVYNEEETLLVSNFMRIRQGAIVHTGNLIAEKPFEDSVQNAMDHIIFEIHKKLNGFSNEVIVPFSPTIKIDNVRFVVPRKGKKKEILLLSEKNARTALIEYQSLQSEKNENLPDILEEIKKILNLSHIPVHIEIFDNSSLQGDETVSACVVFRNGKPSPNEYRHYLIKTVEGYNDFAFMEEVIYRRYKRLIDEKQSLPQIVLVDGGKGQVEAAARSLNKLKILDKVKLLGIAKRLENIFIYGEHLPLYLDKQSPILHLFQHMRNEAHRFVLKHHRQRRLKKLVSSQIEKLKGIGPATTQKLLSHFGSVEKIKQATLKQLAEIVGFHKATILKNALISEDKT